MELKKLRKVVLNTVSKYRFVALLLIIGIFLMILPINKKRETSNTPVPITDMVSESSLEERLKQLLMQVYGAGDVMVLLSEGEGERTFYQTDTDISNGEINETERKTTVTVTDAERNQTGLIQQINPPTYIGAIILCEGADNPEVRLSVKEAVSKATGLGLNHISVLKMK